MYVSGHRRQGAGDRMLGRAKGLRRTSTPAGRGTEHVKDTEIPRAVAAAVDTAAEYGLGTDDAAV
ncbi:hypothetical protein ACWDR9_04765, partial [Streptosporangium sandarakinum]